MFRKGLLFIAFCLTILPALAAQVLPYSCDLETADELATWTIYDANQDGNTWQIGSKWTDGNDGRSGAEVYRSQGYGDNDDWLISPSAQLTAGVATRVTFRMLMTYYAQEKLEVRLASTGQEPENSQLLTTLELKGSQGYYSGGYIATIDIPGETITADGDYRIMLRYNIEQGDNSSQGMHINDFAWRENNSATVSGTVRYGSMVTFPCQGATVTIGELSATTDYNGRYSISDVPAGEYDITATYVTGYAPATEHIVLNVGDDVTQDFLLSALPRHTLSGTVTDEDGNPIYGATATLTGYDEAQATTAADGTWSITAYQGDYTLEVHKNYYHTSDPQEIALTADQQGADCQLSVEYLPPYSATATATGSNVAVTWRKPVPLTELAYDNGTYNDAYGYGENGGDLQVVGVIFPGETTLYELSWWTVHKEEYDENIRLLVIDLDYGGNPTGEVLYQATVPSGAGGWSSHRLEQPLYAERGFLFAINGRTAVATDGGTADGSIDHPQTQTYTTTYTAASSYRYFDDLSTLPSRHLLMRAHCLRTEPEGATEPAMKYDVYRLQPGMQNQMLQWTAVASGIDGTACTDSNMPSGEYLYAVLTNYGSATSEATFTGTVAMNMDARVTVNVSANSDPSHANGAAVTLYGQSNYTATATGGVATFEQVTKGTYAIGIRQNGFETLTAEGLNITGEENDYTFSFTLTQLLDLPASLDVMVDGSTAQVVWNVQQNIVDSFDGTEYNDFEVNPAGNVGWQYIDNDGLATLGFGYTTFPHMREPMAAITFNSHTTTPPLGQNEGEQVETAHTGFRALAFFSAAETSGEAGVTHNESDDYMFTPQLNLYRDVTFSFWARSYELYNGNERLRVGYSTTTPEIESVTWIDQELQYVPLSYTYYEYAIPQEARYVVLNSSSISNFFLLVDDIFLGTESQVTGCSYMPVNVEGYEVYLDGAKVADTTERSHTFTDLGSGTHTASIVQVFATGKSAPLDVTFEIAQSGIANIDGAQDVRIYAHGGNLHITGDYERGTVYNAAGAAVMQLHGEQEADVAALPAGVYIVKAGHAVAKVVLQ